MKKIFALMMASALLVCSLASCAGSLGDPDAIGNYTPEVDYIVTEQGTFTFEEADGNTAVLVKYVGKATRDDHVVIPSEFNGRKVAAIGNEAFYNLAAVVAVTIPESVTTIGKYAFAGCTELTEVTLPKNALTVEDYAFAGCTKLATINFGSALTEIGDKAFWNCEALANATLPATLETIGDGAFWNCTALTEVTMPASLKTIGTLAYYNCTGVTSIKLHDDIEKIGEYAFVTDGSTLKDKIDVSACTPDGYVAKYVAEIAEPAPVEEETEANA